MYTTEIQYQRSKEINLVLAQIHRNNTHNREKKGGARKAVIIHRSGGIEIKKKKKKKKEEECPYSNGRVKDVYK